MPHCQTCTCPPPPPGTITEDLILDVIKTAPNWTMGRTEINRRITSSLPREQRTEVAARTAPLLDRLLRSKALRMTTTGRNPVGGQPIQKFTFL